MSEQGWAVGILLEGPAEGLLDALTELVEPTLLVLDWAYTPLDPVLTVIERALLRRSNEPFRILVLVDEGGMPEVPELPGVESAPSGVRSVWDSALHIPLGPLVTVADRHEAFRRAVNAFSPRLSQFPELAHEYWSEITNRVKIPDLDRPGFDAIGRIQTAALRALFAASRAPRVVIDAVEQFEERYLPYSSDPRSTSESSAQPTPPAPLGEAALHTRGFGDRKADVDLLDRMAIVRAIADLLLPAPATASEVGLGHRDMTGPAVVALEGPWGSGKTTTMGLIEQELERRLASDPGQQEPTTADRPPARTHLSAAEAHRLLAGRNPKKPPSQAPSATPRRRPVIARFDPWSHQSDEQVWAGLTAAVLESTQPCLGPDVKSRERYWLLRNRIRLDTRQLRMTFWRNIRSPLFKVAVFALLVPVIAQLAKDDKRYDLWGWKATAPSLALLLPAALVVIGLAHSAVRFCFGRARSYLPAEILDGPVLSGALAPGASPAVDPALRDPLYHARSGYLYLVQHDIRELLASLRDSGDELIVFVDDLDRCSPKATAEVFEAINLFLSGALNNDKGQCRFVIGLDPAVVARHLDQVYQDKESGPKAQRPPNGDPSWGWTFLRKLIQLPVPLPPVDNAGITSALAGLLGPVMESTHLPVSVATAPEAAETEEETVEAPHGPEVEEAVQGRTSPSSAPAMESSAAAPAPTGIGIQQELESESAAQAQARNLETHPTVRALLEQRLGEQTDLSIREAKRLLTIWQFYLRVVGHKERGPHRLSVDQALHLVVLAEIAARWPALQAHLHRAVDGRLGLYWLALGAPDDQAWQQALRRTGLEQEDNGVCEALRELLRKHDGERVAAVAERL
ncbi:KAP family P-loop NTPase fold protein [Streptomyces sp. CA-249302]|uniref:KAP family P-loop NTPase fold protein n=1 Tax=Streptomyces sp. CA-249302 TaxID=3240058 RepID=UPI003D8D7057